MLGHHLASQNTVPSSCLQGKVSTISGKEPQSQYRKDKADVYHGQSLAGHSHSASPPDTPQHGFGLLIRHVFADQAHES
jgi:hypothetical protein